MTKIITLDCEHKADVPDNFEQKPLYCVICKECLTGYTFLFGR